MNGYEPVRLGVVGLGDVATRTYLPTMAEFAAKWKFTAACHPKAGKRERATGEFGAAKAYADYAEMVADPDVEAVLIFTPKATHFPMAMAGLQAGKHVFVEKTMAHTTGDAGRLIDGANARGLVLGCAPAIAAAPITQAMERILRSGELGRVCYVRGQTVGFGPASGKFHQSSPAWFYGAEAGPVRDRGIYLLHLFARLFGPAKRVTALEGIALPERTVAHGPFQGTRIPVESPDNAHLLLDYGDTVYGSLTSTFCAWATKCPDLEIFCEKGVLSARVNMMNPQLEIYEAGKEAWREVERIGRWGLSPGIERFLDKVRTGKEMGFSAEEARHVIEIIEAGEKSGREGRAVELRTAF